MHRLAGLATLLTCLLVAPAALAQDRAAPSAFKDVPPDHWAAAAVKEMAIEHAFIRGFPDGTFRGDEPFTRVQLALAVKALLVQLEGVTHCSWQTSGLGGYSFKDLPADASAAATVQELANRYRLFEGVPGVTSLTFEADKQVTRYEMAKVIYRLMRLGEDRGVVDPTVLAPQPHAFMDLPTTAWDYDAVKDVADRYQVMVGFPDGTFRGPEKLTRYQFAATASQTFPLVRELVQKTQVHQERARVEAAARGWRYMEGMPLYVGARELPGAAWPAVNIRGVTYAGPFMGLADLDAGLGASAAPVTLQHDLGLDGGYAFGIIEGATVAPYLGLRLFNVPAYTLAALDYGLVAYYRTGTAWGAFANLRGTSPLGATAGTVLGVFLGSATVGMELNFTPALALSAEAGYALWPSATLASASAPLGAYGTPIVSLGLAFHP